MNWYSYCSGNPVAFADPSGLGTIVSGSVDFIYNDVQYRINEASVDVGVINKSEQLTVDINTDYVSILSYIKFSGDADSKPVFSSTGNRHKEIVVREVQKFWSGIYDGKYINVVLLEVMQDNSKGQKQRYTDVNILNTEGRSNLTCYEDIVGTGWITLKVKWYNEWEIGRVASHEFGHLFGIGDMYNDELFKREKITDGTWDIMNNHLDYRITGASEADYFMMFCAHREGKMQIWGDRLEYFQNNKLLPIYQ